MLFTGSSAETTPISKTRACPCLSSAAMIHAPFPASLKRWGVEGADRYVDATTLKTESEVERALACDSVFGCVKPEQKKQFVLALQKAGHAVAMTGDGVNDTLALKAADCSVAMAAGSDAARNVAQLVLVDNDFASMPKVVAEGRRSTCFT